MFALLDSSLTFRVMKFCSVEPGLNRARYAFIKSSVVGLGFIKGVWECLDFDYHWQYLARLLFWARQLQKRKLVIVGTSGTIAITNSVAVAIRDTHRDIISPGMNIPGL